MKILKHDNTTLDVKVIEYTHSITLSYRFIETSGSKLRSIDRGTSGDRYETTFTFRGKKDYIFSIYNTLQELRENKKQVILSELDERFFGDNISSTTINTVITGMDKMESPTFNSYQLSVTLLADTATLTFDGTAIIPLGLKCLQSGYETSTQWNSNVNETYYRNAYFVDREVDRYTFIGEYLLSVSDMKNLLTFHKTYRGNELIVQESQFGVTNMFGSDKIDTEHTVVIDSVEYERVANNLKRVKIQLMKVD